MPLSSQRRVQLAGPPSASSGPHLPLAKGEPASDGLKRSRPEDVDELSPPALVKCKLSKVVPLAAEESGIVVDVGFCAVGCQRKTGHVGLCLTKGGQVLRSLALPAALPPC